MAQVLVNAEFEFPGAQVWELLRDFGNLSWIPGNENFQVNIEGDGPGMVRQIVMGDAPGVREELYERDDDERRITYGVTDNNPLPCTNYRATMIISDDGPKKAKLAWSSTFDPRDCSEAEAVAAVEGFYAMLLESIRATLGRM
ncbi:MAG: SRPBCC family protein [bacterium]|nr:SRPBCC family protein [bacterium]